MPSVRYTASKAQDKPEADGAQDMAAHTALASCNTGAHTAFSYDLTHDTTVPAKSSLMDSAGPAHHRQRERERERERERVYRHELEHVSAPPALHQGCAYCDRSAHARCSHTAPDHRQAHTA